MADKSPIEWLRGADGAEGSSWNPIRARNKATGGIGHFCVHKTEACRNCYAETFQKRFNNPVRYIRQDRDKVALFLDDATLRAPLHWKKPRRVFPCSMTDLFLEDHPAAWIARHFAVMALTPQHTYIVLTKRGEYLSVLLNDPAFVEAVDKAMDEIAPAHWCARELDDYDGWPLRNVWIGGSCHDQDSANQIIPLILAAPAAVRFISAEPLLGPIDLTEIEHAPGHCIQALWGLKAHTDGTATYGAKLDWVIVGGESGRGDAIRPMHPDWARQLRDQCVAAGVAFFFKQWGAWAPSDDHPRREQIGIDPEIAAHDCAFDVSAAVEMARIGKKAAGRLLDSREWNQMPQGRPREPGLAGGGRVGK